MRQATIELVKFHLAGEIAELRFLNDNGSSISSTTSAGYDHSMVDHYITTSAGNGEPIDREYLRVETTRLINNPQVWSMVQRLAAELYQTKNLEDSALQIALVPIISELESAGERQIS